MVKRILSVQENSTNPGPHGGNEVGLSFDVATQRMDMYVWICMDIIL